MSAAPDPNDKAGAEAAQKLAQLQLKVEEARAVLARLLQDVAAAERHLDVNQIARMLEANAELVVAALQSQSVAETAAQALDEVSHSAGHDALTQLPNRVLLLDRLAHAIAGAERHNPRLALLFLDIDNFKHINDAYGHAVGDAVLELAARRLVSSVRAADTVSRYGGDEFLILLSEVAHPEDATLIADKVIAAIGALSHVGGQVLQLSASVGISLYPDDGVEADTLIACADASMYRAKQHGGGSYAIHGHAPVGTPGSVGRRKAVPYDPRGA